ncbi:MAG: hypothetical protein ACLRXQ_05645 [Phascolarctobacterium faecium]
MIACADARGALERSYEEHRLRADEYERLGMTAFAGTCGKPEN